ncbi:MAG: M20/M25/M40 family metallo-hydrolase [Actinomycetia bacterium]|nr:M20/M25/M40 family metallo-hydrolase [Actinomycetes bacterium]
MDQERKNRVNEDRLLDTFFKLLKVKSPTRNEREIVEYVKNILEDMGLKVSIDDSGKNFGSNSGNITALFSNKYKLEGQPIFLNAHLDTVELTGEVEPVLKNGRIVNSNQGCILGGDDKVAVAAIIEAVRVIMEKKIATPDIYLLLTVGEECGIFGAKYIDLEKVRAKYGFTFDADGDIGTIINKAPYQNSFYINFKGKAAHAGIEPEKGINAIEMSSSFVQLCKFGRLDDYSTANVGIIRGGKAKNIVPDKVYMEMEARSLYVDRLNEITDQFLKNARIVEEKYKAKIDVKVEREYDGFDIKEDDISLSIARSAIEKLGIKPRLKATGGGSDVNIINSRGKVAVNLSAGMEKVHTCKEYVKVEQLILLSSLMVEICKSSING